eukprot:6211432-Pleurochrysis_carterae.AAC.3
MDAMVKEQKPACLVVSRWKPRLSMRRFSAKLTQLRSHGPGAKNVESERQDGRGVRSGPMEARRDEDIREKRDEANDISTDAKQAERQEQASEDEKAEKWEGGGR